MTTQTATQLSAIHVSRPKGFADKMRAYHVLLDGQDLGTIKQGQTLSFEVTPTEHEMQLKIDWATSNRLTFDGSESNLEFECGNSMTSLPKLLLAIIYITLRSRNYLWLRQKPASEAKK